MKNNKRRREKGWWDKDRGKGREEYRVEFEYQVVESEERNSFGGGKLFTRRVKSVERFIKRRNGLLCGEKQFPAKQGIKYLSLRAAVQFSERRYARHPEKFIAISILRAYRFHRLHFLASSYILRREQKRDKDKGGEKKFLPLNLFFFNRRMEKKKGKFSPIFVQFFIEKETKPITEGISKNKDATFRTLSRRCVLVIVVSCRIVLVILRKIYFFYFGDV